MHLSAIIWKLPRFKFKDQRVLVFYSYRLKNKQSRHFELSKYKKMNRTGKIISGIALLLFGIIWLLEITHVLTISFDGWWTVFIIVPCLIGFFSFKDKMMSLIGVGTGVLLLLATRDIIAWGDFWKYLICMIAIVWGVALIFSRNFFGNGCPPDKQAIKELKHVNQDGRSIRQISTKFGKQVFEFSGQRFEGATVQTCFGFVGLDLRNADLLDGAVIDIDCSFGGMEIRVDSNVNIKHAIDASFGGVEYNERMFTPDNEKTLYIKGKCAFGGIEIK